MNYQPKKIRAFIGAKNFNESREFYRQLGFVESPISDTMTRFNASPDLGFYLQRAYVKKWVDNTMLFLEVDDLDKCYEDVKSRNLPEQYKLVKLSDIKTLDWGREFFLHDPSGILWHFGVFND